MDDASTMHAILHLRLAHADTLLLPAPRLQWSSCSCCIYIRLHKKELQLSGREVYTGDVCFTGLLQLHSFMGRSWT
jgi:hypothetical protein